MSLFLKHNPLFLLENPDVAEAIQDIMVLKKYAKHEIISQEGTVCNHLYIIISGLARVFYYEEGRDITVHFAMENESITATDSFIQRTKSKYNIEAIEDMEIMAISHQDLENIFKKQPKFERFGRLYMQQIYLDLMERLDDLQLYTAQKRYENLLNKNPKIFLRAPLKHLASFLGMTPETLSRLRSK